jgi:hypothetical protein
VLLVLVFASRPHTPKHIRGNWSHYTNTSEPVEGNGAQNMVTVQSGFWTRDLSIAGPTRLPPALTGPKMTKVGKMCWDCYKPRVARINFISILRKKVRYKVYSRNSRYVCGEINKK